MDTGKLSFLFTILVALLGGLSGWRFAKWKSIDPHIDSELIFGAVLFGIFCGGIIGFFIAKIIFFR